MQHYIETLRPIGFLIDAELVLPAVGVAFVNDRPNDRRAGADALAEDLFLRLVIVTTSARDHQRAQRFHG